MAEHSSPPNVEAPPEDGAERKPAPEENQGELPAPRHDLATSLVTGQSCAAFGDASGGDYDPHGNYDVNGDGVFNVVDYACDSRVAGVVNSLLCHIALPVLSQ